MNIMKIVVQIVFYALTIAAIDCANLSRNVDEIHKYILKSHKIYN
jgi:hypothetical protein